LEASQAAKAAEALRRAPLTAIHPAGLNAKAGENFYWQETATWAEFRTERRYESSYGGTSFRATKGMSLHAGSSSGQSRSVIVPQVTAGTVYLSNKRLIFISPTFSREVKLDAALKFETGSGLVQADLPNKNSIQADTGNAALGIVLDKILRANRGEADDPGSNIAQAATSTPVLDRFLALLDEKLPELQKEHAAATDGALLATGSPLSDSGSLAWVDRALETLGALGPELSALLVTDLQGALAEADDEHAAISQAHWLHSCAGYFYKLTDWELGVKAVALAPRFARVQALMRGNTNALSAPVLQLPGRLRATKEQHVAGARHLSLSSTVETNMLQPLIAEVSRVRALVR
jgi:hypothetical protein